MVKDGDAPKMFNTILIPIDGSVQSRRATELGCDLAGKYGASIHFLHIAQSPVRDQEFAFGGAARAVRVAMYAPPEELHRAAEHLMQAAVEYASQHGCKQVTTEIATGGPAQRILQTAEDIKADVIVMGSRGLGDVSGILKGSVSHKVNHLAKCTCITVT